MNCRRTWVTLLVGLGLVAASGNAARASVCRHPNFVVIVADDLGFGDVGYHGSAGLTPVIDQLAANSVRLEQHYTFPECCPTRAALLTGRYASRFGCTGSTSKQVLPLQVMTVAAAQNVRMAASSRADPGEACADSAAADPSATRAASNRAHVMRQDLTTVAGRSKRTIACRCQCGPAARQTG